MFDPQIFRPFQLCRWGFARLLPKAAQYDVPLSIFVPKIENTVSTNTELPHIVHFLRSSQFNELGGSGLLKSLHCSPDFCGLIFCARLKHTRHVFIVWA